MVLNVETIHNLPSIEDVLNRLLSKFLNFVSNDSGYYGTNHDFMVNLVHPMFLKVKGEEIKDEKRNWRRQ